MKKVAQVGNTVQWDCKTSKRSLRGKVLSVYENSVLVDVRINENWESLGFQDRTVVGHRKYTIIDDTAASEEVLGMSTYKVEPGSVENYHALRKAGIKDGKVREMWKEADKDVVWHVGRFYEWKRKNGIVAADYKNAEDDLKPVEKAEPVEEVQPVQPVPEKPVESVEEKPQTQIDMLKEIIPDHPIFADAEPAKTETGSPEQRVDVDALLKELDAVKGQLWSERTARLFEMQARLDAVICESNSLRLAEHNTEHLLATIVELAEVAQEDQSFKYWKKNKSLDRVKLLEELSDVLHFILSLGVQSGIRRVSIIDGEPDKRNTAAEQMLYIVELLLACRDQESADAHYPTLFSAFVELTGMYGYSWEEISDAYAKKNYVNLARQNQNY